MSDQPIPFRQGARPGPFYGGMDIQAPNPPNMITDTQVELSFENRGSDVLVAFTGGGGLGYFSLSNKDMNALQALRKLIATVNDWAAKAEAEHVTDFSKTITTIPSADRVPIQFVMEFGQVNQGQLSWAVRLRPPATQPFQSYESISRYEFPAFVAAVEHLQEFAENFKRVSDQRLAQIANERARKEKVFESVPP